MKARGATTKKVCESLVTDPQAVAPSVYTSLNSGARFAELRKKNVNTPGFLHNPCSLFTDFLLKIFY